MTDVASKLVRLVRVGGGVPFRVGRIGAKTTTENGT